MIIISIQILGEEKMESDSIRKYLSSKEGIMNFEDVYLKEDGIKMKMFGHPILTSNGQLEFATLTTLP